MKKFLLGMFLLITTVLNAEVKVLAFAGSTRTDSYNKKLVMNAADVAREMGAKVTVVDLKDYPIPFYDADLETQSGMPEKAKEIRRLMLESQVIFIASPDYNSSVSAVLKNVLDWASRSESGKPSRDAFLNKKFGLMSASPGRSGGADGLAHLRDIIGDIRGIIIPHQFCVPLAHEAFDENGKLKDANLIASLKALVFEAISENKE